MNIAQLNNKDLDIDYPNAKLAYTIIQSLLRNQEALSDLLALMAHALDEDVAKALTNTTEWEKYLDAKRELENTKLQIEKFTEELKKMENGKWKMENSGE
jgi:midasin (ATPase involved in ribosome maturation)